MNRKTVSVSDLVAVTDSYPVEFIGGPNDGEQRPANENGLRPGGLYVTVSDATGRGIAARRYAKSPTDTERLNWIEAGGHSAMHYGNRRYQVHDQSGTGLRETIDAAIKAADGWLVRSEQRES